jgi:hypothetical protein
VRASEPFDTGREGSADSEQIRFSWDPDRIAGSMSFHRTADLGDSGQLYGEMGRRLASIELMACIDRR